MARRSGCTLLYDDEERMAAKVLGARKADWAERWVRSGLELSTPPAFFEVLQVDMTEARAAELEKSLQALVGPGDNNN